MAEAVQAGTDLHVPLPCQHAGGLLAATVGGALVSAEASAYHEGRVGSRPDRVRSPLCR
jgi:hypothetical protein